MERLNDPSPIEVPAKTKGNTQMPAWSDVTTSRCLSNPPQVISGSSEMHTPGTAVLCGAGLISEQCRMYLPVYFETKDRHIPPADKFFSLQDVCVALFLVLSNPRGLTGLAVLVLVFVFRLLSDYQMTSHRRCMSWLERVVG